MIRECEVIPVPDQVSEDMNVLHPDYEAVRDAPLPLPDWSEPEIADLDTLSIPVLTFTRAWVDMHVSRLEGKSISLTYNLMGDYRTPTTNRKKQITRGPESRRKELVQLGPPRVVVESPTPLETHSPSIQEVSLFADQRNALNQVQAVQEENQPSRRESVGQSVNAPTRDDQQTDEGTANDTQFQRELETALEDDIVLGDTQPLEADEPHQNDIEVEQVREVEA